MKGAIVAGTPRSACGVWARLVGAGTVALMVAIAAPAAAQSNNRVAAEALFRQARKLLDAGQYAEACEKLAASENLDPAVGTLLNLAHCYEKIGRTATAWATYRDAVNAAKRAGQAERGRLARQAVEALEPLLPRLTIRVSSQAGAAKAEIHRDGEPVPAELWGATVPVDPGEHTISATAPGKKPWSSTVRVDERGSESVEVPALESALPEAGPPAIEGPTPLTSQALRADRPSEPLPAPFWNGKRIAGTAALSVAVAGAAVAVAEALAFKKNVDQESSLCPDNLCPSGAADAAHSLLAQAQTDRTIGVVAGVGGGAALVVGTVLWWTSGRAPSASASGVVLQPLAGAQGFGLSLSGPF